MPKKIFPYLFWFAALCHLILWTLLPGLFHTAYKPDVIELQFVGREWVLATAKHPMLPAWLLELGNIFTGRLFLTPFLVSQLCVLGTICVVWRFSRSVLNERLALVPPFLMLLYWFFTIESIKYNQNITLVLCWTLAIFLLFKSLQTNRIEYWITAGLALGFSFHAKYSTTILVASILVYFMVDSKARRTWKSWGPYITMLVTFFVFLPHLIWMLEHGPAGIKTAFIEHEKTWENRFLFPTRFIICELCYLILPVLALIPLFGIVWKRKPILSENDRWTFRFLTTMIFLPLLFHLLISFVKPTKLNPDYGAPFWPLLGVWLMMLFKFRDDSVTFKRFGAAVLGGELFWVIVFLSQFYVSTYLLGTPRRFHFPMQALGEKCEQIWSEHVSGQCPYTSGDWWIAANAAEYMNPKPSVHAFGAFENMDVDLPLTTWSTDADVNQRGGLILWDKNLYEKGEPKTLRTKFPNAVVLESLILPYENFANVPPVEIGVAIVLPPEHPPTQE